MEIRPLERSDYEEHLVPWWRAWKWEPPPRDFLPGGGTDGFMVEDEDGIPVCAGFFYLTNSKVSWCEFIISNPNYKDRKEALELLIRTILAVCEGSGAKYCYSILKNKSLISLYEEIGFIQGDKDCIDMVLRF